MGIIKNITLVALLLLLSFSFSRKRYLYSNVILPTWDIVFTFGQSNMQGAGETVAPVEFQGEYDNVYIAGRIDTAIKKFNHPVNDESALCGIHPFFVKKWYDKTENKGRKLMIVNVSKGGAPLFDSETFEDFNVNTDELYSISVSQINKALNYIGEESYRLMPVIWMQGETDAGNITGSSEYQNNIQEFWDSLKINTNINNTFICTLMGATKTYEYKSTVRQAKINFANINSDVVSFDLQGYSLQSDSIHHTTNAYQDIGNDLFEFIYNNNLFK